MKWYYCTQVYYEFYHRYNYYFVEEFSVENLFDRLRKVLTAEKSCVNLTDFTEIISVKNQLLSKILIEEMLDQGLLASDESELELSYYENKILNYEI